MAGFGKTDGPADPNEWMIEWYKRNGFVEKGLRSDGLVNLEKNLD